MSTLGTFIGVTVFYCALPFVRVFQKFSQKHFRNFEKICKTLLSLPVNTVHLEGIKEEPRVSNVHLGVFCPKVTSILTLRRGFILEVFGFSGFLMVLGTIRAPTVQLGPYYKESYQILTTLLKKAKNSFGTTK